jgi:hypothetical protein
MGKVAISQDELDALIGAAAGVLWWQIKHGTETYHAAYNENYNKDVAGKIRGWIGGATLPDKFPCDVLLDGRMIHNLRCWNSHKEQTAVREKKYAEAESYRRRAHELGELEKGR